MANEIPLNLFGCEYDDIKWYHNEESLSQVIEKLNTLWTYSAAKYGFDLFFILFFFSIVSAFQGEYDKRNVKKFK